MAKPSNSGPPTVAAPAGSARGRLVRAIRALWAPAVCGLAVAVLVWSLMVQTSPRPAPPPPSPRALDARARTDLEARLWGHLLHARFGEVEGAEKDLGLHPDAAADARSGRAFAPLVARFDDALTLVVADVKQDSAKVYLRLSADRVAEGTVYYDLRSGRATVRDFKYGTARRLDRAEWADLVSRAAAEARAAEDERAAADAAATTAAAGEPAPAGRSLLVVRLVSAVVAGAGILAVARKLRARGDPAPRAGRSAPAPETVPARAAAGAAAVAGGVFSRPKFPKALPTPTRSSRAV